MIETTDTTATFNIHAKDGSVLADAQYFEDAIDLMKKIDAAESITRIADGVLLAKKQRFGRRRQAPAPAHIATPKPDPNPTDPILAAAESAPVVQETHEELENMPAAMVEVVAGARAVAHDENTQQLAVYAEDVATSAPDVPAAMTVSEGDDTLTHEEVVARAERFAEKLHKPSFDAVLAALDAGELSGPDELRARMLRHLLGAEKPVAA